MQGEFELVASPSLLAELERALAYPKLRRRIRDDEARAVLDLITVSATLSQDLSGPPPVRSVDPGDDYLLALAFSENALLVSGDQHLLSLADELPIRSPRDFLALLQEARP